MKKIEIEYPTMNKNRPEHGRSILAFNYNSQFLIDSITMTDERRCIRNYIFKI